MKREELTRAHTFICILQLWTKEAVKNDDYGQQYQRSIHRRRPWMGREGGPASN